MEDTIRDTGLIEVRAGGRPARAISIFAALALVVAGVVLARHGADPVVPDSKIVVDAPQFDNIGGAIGQTLGLGAGVQPQISISAIVCPILNALGAIFGPLLGPVINSLRILFGCASL